MQYPEFREKILSIIDEVGKPDSDGKVGRHSTWLRVTSDTDEDFEIVDVQPDTAPGCGCWTGVNIHIRKKP